MDVKLKEMQPLDFSNVFYLPQYRKGIDLIVTKGYLDVTDQLDYLGFFWGPNAFFNYSGFSDPTMEDQITQARSTYDPVARANLLVKAQATYTKGMVVIPIVNGVEITYMNNRITGAPTSFAYIFLPVVRDDRRAVGRSAGMWRYLLRKLGGLAITLFIASFLIYGAMYLAPGDPSR